MIFETYHTIPNVNESNNKFYFDKDDAEITIPEGSYEVRDINEFLKRAILRSRRDALETVDNYNSDYNTDDDDDGEARRSLARRTLNFYNLWDSRCATFEMIDILNITGEPIFDDRIVKIVTHTYNPFAITTFGYSDEIRIPIQQQDLYDFGKKRYAVLFDMYARFRRAYYGNDCFETLLNVLSFTEKGPFVVIDCSRQNESVKGATVDVRIEFDCKENVPANTTAYCLIIHDRVIQYNPLTNVVRKIT
ncbi:hypothetical protein ALC57_17061 [Trachymyrmex cornetzi]|uniref:Double jelly roll-like domain-containing protein n=1 Tax=Trachymyrmex cornetzi TaxID=471704 RepID=A0A151ITU0_9HYME|nr:hypothetical protein ALC57_17061 [Trachymyrmex cornetzi]